MLLEKISISKKLELIEFIISANLNNKIIFRLWHYLIRLFNLSLKALSELEYLNIEYLMSIKDRVFLKRLVLSFSTKKYIALITLREISLNRHFTNK